MVKAVWGVVNGDHKQLKLLMGKLPCFGSGDKSSTFEAFVRGRGK